MNEELKDNRCNKCNKIFNNKYSLKSHLNKKFPCGEKVIFQCEKCNIIFPAKQALLRHKNRKNPCKVSTKSEIENEIKILEKKFEIEKELLKLKEESKLKLIEAKKEANLTAARQKIELKQSIQINNNNTNNIQNNFYIAPPTTPTHDFTRENMLEFLHNYFLTLSIDNYDMMISPHKNIKEVIIFVLKYTHMNKTFPEFNNIIYISDLDKFYTIKDMEWKEQKFEEVYDTLNELTNKVFGAFSSKGLNYPDKCIGTQYLAMQNYYIKSDEKSKKNRKKDMRMCAEEALINNK
jgi:uncharacterized C2H2 Zn-finger protein/Ni,Fe-hydrogenase I large subunit